jgi:hypothetical protein
MSALPQDFRKFREPGFLVTLFILFVLMALSDVAIWFAYRMDAP